MSDQGAGRERFGGRVGMATLSINGSMAGEVSLALLPWRQTMYGMDIGRDQGSTVSSAYVAPFRFNGRLFRVDYELEDDREDNNKAARIEARNALTDQ